MKRGELLPHTRTFREFMTTDFSEEDREPPLGEPGDPVYDAWLEEGYRTSYDNLDPATFTPLVIVDDNGRVIAKERPPRSFRERVREAKAQRVITPRRRAARPRQRRTRTTSPTRGSPDDDPDEHFAWFERTGQVDRYYESVDPRTYAPFVVRLDDGNIVSENPPSWFLKKLNRERPPLRTPQPVPSPMVPPRRRRRR
jgi:hypothetical protein